MGTWFPEPYDPAETVVLCSCPGPTLSAERSALVMVLSAILLPLTTPVPMIGFVIVSVVTVAESAVKLPLTVRVLAPVLMTVVASKVMLSLNWAKSRELLEMSVARMAPSKILPESITPVPTNGLVRVSVEMLAESMMTVPPLKLKLNPPLEMTVLASRVMESLKAVKSRELAATEAETSLPHLTIPLASVVSFPPLVPTEQFKPESHRVEIPAASKFTALPVKLRAKSELDMTVFVSRAMESLKKVKSSELAVIPPLGAQIGKPPETVKTIPSVPELSVVRELVPEA